MPNSANVFFNDPICYLNEFNNQVGEQEVIKINEEKLVYARYIGLIDKKVFISIKNEQLRLIEENQIKCILEDASKGSGNLYTFKDYLFDIYDLKATQLGLQKHAIILSSNPVLLFSINMIVSFKSKNRKFDVRVFKSYEEALKWLSI